jgi:hypothetical protein
MPQKIRASPYPKSTSTIGGNIIGRPGAFYLLLHIHEAGIRKFLEEYSGDENTDLYSKAKRLVGVVESGIADLGQNHRDHLIKKISRKLKT